MKKILIIVILTFSSISNANMLTVTTKDENGKMIEHTSVPFVPPNITKDSPLPPTLAIHIQHITLAWDANVEPDLKGYRIYYGGKTRIEITDAINIWCEEHESHKLEECIKEWEVICSQDGEVDPACHSMLFGYETMVDVKNVNEYTIQGLEEGKTYYFAATAYDDDDNESAYSMELSHTFINKPKGLKYFDSTSYIIEEMERIRNEFWR
jgi:hypothetical protein